MTCSTQSTICSACSTQCSQRGSQKSLDLSAPWRVRLEVLAWVALAHLLVIQAWALSDKFVAIQAAYGM